MYGDVVSDVADNVEGQMRLVRLRYPPQALAPSQVGPKNHRLLALCPVPEALPFEENMFN